MDKVSKEVKIGLAFIIAIFILYFGISFLKGINIFKPSNSYMVVFDNVAGLTQSTPVTLNGFNVGMVSKMKLDPNNQKRVIVYVNMDKGVKIPQGSKLTLDVGLLSSATITMELNPYTKEYFSSDDTIVGIKKKSIMSTADNFLPKIEQLIPKIDSILIGIQALVNHPSLSQSLVNVSLVTEELAKSTKQLNSMMLALNKDVPVISNNLNNMSNDISGLTRQLKQIELAPIYQSLDSTTKNIHILSSKLTSTEGSLGLLLNDRKLYDSINSTLNNAALLLKDLRVNPSRYINVKVF